MANFVLVEALIAPRRNAAGKTLSELHFREKFGLTAVALWREGRSIRTDLQTAAALWRRAAVPRPA